MTLPYFSFYPKDWLGDSRVQSLRPMEEWAYFRLLLHCWTYNGSCSLPNDDDVLARLLRISLDEWLQIRRVLIDGPDPLFDVTPDGRITNSRLLAEHQAASRKSEAAKQAISTRWRQYGRNTDVIRPKYERNTDVVRTYYYSESDPESESESSTIDIESTRSRGGSGGGADDISPDGSGVSDETPPTPSPKPTPTEHVPYQAIANVWNEVCGGILPRVQALSSKRRDKLRVRCHELAQLYGQQVYSVEWWRALFERVRASPFLRGENKNSWHATYDWLIERRDAIVRTLEGHYDSTGQKGALSAERQRERQQWLDSIERWERENTIWSHPPRDDREH